MKKISILLLFIYFLFFQLLADENIGFDDWKINFKKVALKNNISEKTFDLVMSDARFLPKVIQYDRYQPEFYEDTKTYVSKRTNIKKINKGINFYLKNLDLINKVEKKYSIEKEFLLALMGIETNFGSYVGKMDIISSLSTLSYDKRRSEFFTNELLTVLKLVEANKIDHQTLYGSWAGAFGFFQFMPTTIENYAIDYNNDQYIDLKNTEDAFASAANYLNKIGWKKNLPCFVKIDLKEDIPKKYLNSSARKIKNKKKINYLNQYIDTDLSSFDKNLKIAIITPDKDIVENADILNPAYVVFDNYEIILQWNRSLRFALAVCTLKDRIKNEL
jgi:membrane-bound lytic murein transglycosylase B